MPAPPRSLLLRLYLAASWRSASLARRALERRRAEGKEDGARLRERMGEAGLPRPDGRLVWFHAASVGEAASLIELLRRLQQIRLSDSTASEFGQAASDLARRNPWLGVGAAFAAGFLASNSKTTEQLLAELLRQARNE
jgi:hypothetical protein